MSMLQGALDGGCLCGSIRYRVGEISDAGYCHCKGCRRSSGAPVIAWARVAGEHFELTRGTPCVHAGSDHGERSFCGDCGSSLYFRKASEDHYSVFVATLDAPESVAPCVHMNVEEQLPWLKTLDFLPTFEGGSVPDPGQRSPLRAEPCPALTADAAISLREIGADNLTPVLLLDVEGGQRRYVAANAISLAQAMFDKDARLRAVYADETAVGFLYLVHLDEDHFGLPMTGDAFLVRLLVDERFQGLGFGRRAVEAAVAEVRSWSGTTSLWTSCVLGKLGPYGFYRDFGFEDTGTDDSDGERILRLAVAGRES